MLIKKPYHSISEGKQEGRFLSVAAGDVLNNVLPHTGLLSMDGNGDADDKPKKPYNSSCTWFGDNEPTR